MFLKLTFSKVYRKHYFYIIERETSTFRQRFKEKLRILNDVLNVQISFKRWFLN